MFRNVMAFTLPPPKTPFDRTVAYGVARKNPNLCSRKAATGALAQGGAEGGTLGRIPNQASPEGAAGRPPEPIFMALL